ncbi:MAG: ATP-binding cassette domain-containing protein [Firmicutes bacterium]|nr:ATP-binding cassette domain-containing protein [Bacillota bacterium]
MIELFNLTKNFKEVKAVDNISFKVNRGEVFGLLGENGAGKTTTLRMLATMLKPTSGKVLIDGENLLDEPEKVRSKIGILFGGTTGLYDRLTAYENIEYFGLLNGMDKREIKYSINNLIKDLDMNEYINRKVGKFSKGMKQKVAIARSIVHDPKIMFFDEPTSGLDVTSVRMVHKFIDKLRKSGKTIVFSSHSMKEVDKLCDTVGIIHKGKMAEVTSLFDLRNKYNDLDLEEIFIEIIGDKNEH